ncbi:unnamed protein product [Rotaria socialis]|uniref:C2 domain-containing protein n=1 Tax=Rotaria socialis TaxID=392032 RepID=A0A817ZKS1_9BILA|nr:unnamed protein product [Rotaria socialis]CAF3392773.1 unnamed protein product [Rotaria socialis]CAF4345848.1 unnamed protein product [Rotaria socialis]CAF4372664.1 unnamed protein product [Rotaria socialis]
MSNENTIHQSTLNYNNNNQSNSSLSNLNGTFLDENSSKYEMDTIEESPSVSRFPERHRSVNISNIGRIPLRRRIKKALGTATPTSISNRLVFFKKMKSPINGSDISHRIPSAIWNGVNKYLPLPLPSVCSISEAKLSSTSEGNQNSKNNEIDSSSELSPRDRSTTRHEFRNTTVSNDSFNAGSDDAIAASSTQKTGLTRALSTKALNFNKFKDQFTHHARTVITKTPSLSSLLTTTSTAVNASNENNNKNIVYWTEVFIERGNDLSSKDIDGTSDPYVKVLYGAEEKYTTNIMSSDLNPAWNEKFTFFVHDLNLPLQFNIFDHDRIGRDESMGSVKLDLSRIPIDRLYSATLELENEQRNDGKTGMLKISVTLTSKSSEFRDEVIRTLNKQSNMRSLIGGRSGVNNGVILTRRTIDVFLIQGRNLTSFNSNKPCSAYVKLKFGLNRKYRTQTIKSNSNPKWHQSFMYDTNLTILPPLEFTVYDDTNASAEFIGRATCNLSHLAEEQTHKLPVELEDNAGTIDVFITITGTTPLQEATNDGDSSCNVALEYIPSKLTDEDIGRYKLLSTFRSIVPIFDVGKVEIKIYQARDLSSKDINGKSDPFCVVELDGNRLRTHTIYKTLGPAWNKSFIIPVQDIHSTLDLTIYDEDSNKTSEFLGRVSIPLLSINNGQKKWMGLKDEKCLLPMKGAIEIEATLVYTNLKAVIRTFNPRQTSYYKAEEKFSVAAVKQHVTRVENIVTSILNVLKFIDYCFHWENPWLSFSAFMVSLIIVWNFELYMLPCIFVILLARNIVIEYRQGRLGKAYTGLNDETIAAMVQPAPVDEEMLDSEGNPKEQKKSFLSFISTIQDTILEIQGYLDAVASTFERVKNVFNFTVPWLSILLTIVLAIVAVILYYIPLRYLILAFVINKFTKRFRKPKDFIDNNEVADFISRLPSDVELMQFREIKYISPISTQKKTKGPTTNSKS